MTPADFTAFVALCKERGLNQKSVAALLKIDPARMTAYQSKIPAAQSGILALACAAVVAGLTPFSAARRAAQAKPACKKATPAPRR